MNKRDIRLYFADFWPGFDVNNNFFLQLLLPHYNIIIDPVSPEFLIYGVYSSNFLKYKNVVKIFFTAENVRPNLGVCDYALTFDLISDKRHLRLPLYSLYTSVWGVDSLLKPKNMDEIESQKTKFCNMVVSNPGAKERLEFFQILCDMKKVDSGGGVLNNIGYKLGRSVEDKCQFINQYKFTMAFENSSYPGYTTEKIVEPMRMNSIPIYWGNPRIGEEFNPKSFINVHDFSTLREAAEYVVDIDNSPEKYREIIKEPWFVNNVANEYLDYDRVLSFLKDIIENGKTSLRNRSLSQLAAVSEVQYKKIKAKITRKAYCHTSSW
ncbi:glycosyltransferase family 10 [Chitinophagaceae bacterium 26-R-25]|nr:glycosyltransferase family 10 [Chitinophagaceae bacterium 26-R-25]